MKRTNKILKSKILFLILTFVSVTLLAQNKGELKNGLIGLYYSDANLVKPKSVWTLNNVNSEETEWYSSNDFSGQWIGYLKASKSGEINFYGEANNELQVVIAGIKVIDTWEKNDKTDGKLNLLKGELYPISIKYRQLGGLTYMKLYWGLQGNLQEIIPSSALYYSTTDQNKIMQEFSSTLNVDTKELDFDISSIITIHNSKDLVEKRELLIDKIWGDEGLPKDRLPKDVDKGITDSDFTSLNNLKQIDRLTIDMDFGLQSIAYHFIPTKSNNELAVYHQGHDGNFSVGIETINAFLEKGYHVIALSMPVKGMNSKPIVNLERFGLVKIEKHEQFRFLNPDKGIPVKYYLEPVTVVLNYAEKFNFKRTIMIGLSGGGWTTTQYAAMDTRIDISFPVAGSLPVYVRMRELDNLSTFYGDYEQSIPEILEIANYLELYIMASNGKNRSQLQILNEFDNCCFRGTGANSYKEIVKNTVSSLGEGSYNLFIDATHTKHQISSKALELIFKHLQNI
jgi:hypothetical protein